MKIIALLPMKGRSERVPDKNLRLLAGRPLYHHVARILDDSDLVEAIIINTDSERIAEDATRHFPRVRIHIRPEAIRGDRVSMNAIIADDLSRSGGEHFVQTHSTNPLLTAVTLDAAIRTYFACLRRHDSLFAVTRLQARLYWASGEPVNHDPQALLRTQDLPPLFEENSNFFLFSKSSFAAAGNRRIGNNPKMFPMDMLEAVDIDEEIHLRMAEVLLRIRTEGVKDA